MHTNILNFGVSKTFIFYFFKYKIQYCEIPLQFKMTVFNYYYDYDFNILICKLFILWHSSSLQCHAVLRNIYYHQPWKQLFCSVLICQTTHVNLHLPSRIITYVYKLHHLN